MVWRRFQLELLRLGHSRITTSSGRHKRGKHNVFHPPAHEADIANTYRLSAMAYLHLLHFLMMSGIDAGQLLSAAA